MKTFLVLLLAMLLLAAVGVTGYTLYQRRQTPAQPAAASSQTAASQADQKPPRNELQKELQQSTTDPELLEKLLYEIGKNPDTVGWLQVPGTDINESVVQTHNNSYYLRRDTRKRDTVYGCYFADYECSVGGRDTLSPNTVIYGHSDLTDNPDGPKFSQLFRYADANFASENNRILLSTPEQTLEWEVFAVFYTTTAFDYIQVNNTPQVQRSILDNAKKLSLHSFGIEPADTDKILTLSTCSVRDGTDGTHRFVVMARLV